MQKKFSNIWANKTECHRQKNKGKEEDKRKSVI